MRGEVRVKEKSTQSTIILVSSRPVHTWYLSVEAEVHTAVLHAGVVIPCVSTFEQVPSETPCKASLSVLPRPSPGGPSGVAGKGATWGWARPDGTL